MARRPKSPRASVEDELAALDALPAERPAKVAHLTRCLAGGHYRVIAKAARIAEEALLYELLPALLGAYPRLLEKPVKSDPSCYAKKAIVRALVALDCDDTEFFQAALRYRQPEPVWGGTADTAVDVRAGAAMGLVASGYSRALVELTALLNDPEAEARAGAVRAIGCGAARDAELLLRAKALAGDPEPHVLGECFTALLAVEPDESLDFVARYLSHPEEPVRELAALALGESRLDGVVPFLRQAWEQVLVSQSLRHALVRAAAAHRSEAAAAWLAEIIGKERRALVLELLKLLAPYQHQAKLAEKLRVALRERGEQDLVDLVGKLFGP